MHLDSPPKRHRACEGDEAMNSWTSHAFSLDANSTAPAVRIELRDDVEAATYCANRREINVLEERAFELVIRFKCDNDLLSALHRVNAFVNCISLTFQPFEIDESYSATVLSFGAELSSFGREAIRFPRLESLSIKYQPVRWLVLDPSQFPVLKRLTLDYTCQFPLERVSFAHLGTLEKVDLRNLLIADGVGLHETLAALSSRRFPIPPVIERFGLMSYYSGVR